LTAHSSRYQQVMHSEGWRKRRQRALKRAGYRCQKCGSRRQLQVHHLTYARLGRERAADLMVLCRTCHAAEHGSAGAKLAQFAKAIHRRLRRSKR
jgi:5-methylcytosine-specific restriction endonuclease McrA